MKINSYIILFIILNFILSIEGCSVFMAAQEKGVDVNTLASCRTRTCLINDGAVPIKHTQNTEIFQADTPTGSVARAAMHGVLDVATFGVWEVAGTPIEAVENKKQTYAIKVMYTNDDETIKTMQVIH